MAEDPLTESVWDYPRPPALVACGQRVRIELAGVTVADSTAALRGPFKGGDPQPPGGSSLGAGPPFGALRRDRPLISCQGTLQCNMRQA